MELLLLIICLTGLVCSEEITKREEKDVVFTVTTNLTTDFLLKCINETRFDVASLKLGLKDKPVFMINSDPTIEPTGKFMMRTGNSDHIEALEGDDVLLSSKLKDLDPKYHSVSWMKSDFDGKLIAQLENNVVTYDPDLREHLQLNPQSGSLTITNITKRLSDFYCLRTMYGNDLHMMIKYLVHVYKPVSIPNLSVVDHEPSQGHWSCRVYCSVQNSDNMVLTWNRGDTVLNQSSDGELSSCPSHLILTLDVPSSSREDTFTCVAANPVSNQTAVFNTTQWCPFHDDKLTWTKFGVGCSVALGLILIAMISMIVYKTIYQCTRHIDCTDLGTIDGTAQGPTEGDNLVQVYSIVQK